MGQDSAGFVRRVEPLTADPELLEAQLRAFRQTFRLPPPPPLAYWAGVVVGQVAPDFAVLDSRGELRHLADLRGRKNLLLTFFPKCFTSGCSTHLASLRDVYPAFIGNATEVWAVSVDAAAGAEGQLAFAAQLQLPFPLIPDTGRSLSLLYGAVGGCDGIAARLSVLIDKHGVVRLVDTNVRTASHGTDMLNQLAALGMLLPVTEPAPKPAPRPAMTDDSMGGDVAH
jgi:peroxiredoxin Q/BCP